ncbi:kinase-like domain-containing protein [Syncephalis fuscata]|nr:kinase-like domain-containing protein [Syncephalis fuscata]
MFKSVNNAIFALCDCIICYILPNSLSDEDLLYAKIPASWNNLSEEERSNTTAWIEVYGPTPQEFILSNSQSFTIGANQHCDYRLNVKHMPQLCCELTVKDTVITCSSIELPVLTVNGKKLGVCETRKFNGNCYIEIPNCKTTFNVYILERVNTIKVEESIEYQKKIHLPYIITSRKLGQGSYGLVRMGFNRIMRQRVAIKISPQSHSISSFLNEVCALNVVGSHPRVIQLLGWDFTSLNTYLYIQYADGGDLSSYIKRHAPLPEMEAKNIFKQLLEGIQFLHSKAIIHRDIKPGNILLQKYCEYPKVLYTDFGMACFLEPCSVVSDFCGTLSFMAPEVLLWSGKRASLIKDAEEYTEIVDLLDSVPFNIGGYGKPIDMWSLGATLYRMVFKKYPYGASDELEYITNIFEKSLTFDYNNSKRLSDQIVHLMEKLFNIDSSMRYTAEKALDISQFPCF